MAHFKQNLFFFLLSRGVHLATQKRGREFKQIISTLFFSREDGELLIVSEGAGETVRNGKDAETDTIPVQWNT